MTLVEFVGWMAIPVAMIAIVAAIKTRKTPMNQRLEVKRGFVVYELDVIGRSYHREHLVLEYLNAHKAVQDINRSLRLIRV